MLNMMKNKIKKPKVIIKMMKKMYSKWKIRMNMFQTLNKIVKEMNTMIVY